MLDAIVYRAMCAASLPFVVVELVTRVAAWPVLTLAGERLGPFVAFARPQTVPLFVLGLFMTWLYRRK